MLDYDDHDPAHFHVRGPEFRGKVAIADLAVIEGNGRLRPHEAARLRAWAKAHQAELWANWQRPRRQEPLVKIEGTA